MVIRTVETLESAELQAMLHAVREAYGYDFTQYAESSLKRRTIFFMNLRKITTLQQLTELLLAEEAVFEEFIINLSVTVTEMFRDPPFYAALRTKVIKRLATYPFIKIWIAGCATGEEVYSIAILLKEEGLLHRSLIYATDINQHSLWLAREGIFPLDLMNTYTANYLASGGRSDFQSYYTAQYDSALFARNLKDNVVFAPHNLAVDQSFNEFHLILCRNVLIYFNQKLQNRVVNLFHESLCTFGILGLGNKESLLFADKVKSFDIVDKAQKIFMKTV